jgi:hypothetical protein
VVWGGWPGLKECRHSGGGYKHKFKKKNGIFDFVVLHKFSFYMNLVELFHRTYSWPYNFGLGKVPHQSTFVSSLMVGRSCT